MPAPAVAGYATYWKRRPDASVNEPFTRWLSNWSTSSVSRLLADVSETVFPTSLVTLVSTGPVNQTALPWGGPTPSQTYALTFFLPLPASSVWIATPVAFPGPSNQPK